MKRIIKAAITLGLLVAVGGSLWWVLLARGQEAAIAHWFDERQGAGWQAEHGAISVEGFPLRLDREIADIALADPGAGWSWRLPWVDVNGEALAPTRFEITFPPAHQLAIPGERIEFAHDSLVGHAALDPNLRLEWLDGAVSARGMTASAQSGWTGSAETLDASLIKREMGSAPPNSYALSLEATQVLLPGPLLARIDPTGLLEARVEELVFSGTMALAAPLDRQALEDGTLSLTAATIRTARLGWGDMTIAARGRFLIDKRGFPDGEIDVTLGNWRQMIEIAREAEAFDASLLDTAEQALEFIALLAGKGDSLNVPLTLSGGKIRVGPIAIADAPRLAAAR